MNRQLFFNFCLSENLTFANFYEGDNARILQFLKNLSISSDYKGQFIYLWGAGQTGRTHLLLACCNSFSEFNLKVAYLSFKDRAIKPKMLENLESMSLLCLDDLDMIVGDKLWEEAIFHCFNSLLMANGILIVTANASPQALFFTLPDLRSRLSSNIIFKLQPLNDAQKLHALILRAKSRGFNISREVANYLLKHYQRDLKNLFSILEKLSKEALSTKRAFTIPFIKEIIEK